MNKKQVVIVALVVIALVFSGLALAVNFGTLDLKGASQGTSNAVKSPTGGVIIQVEQNPEIANNP